MPKYFLPILGLIIVIGAGGWLVQRDLHPTVAVIASPTPVPVSPTPFLSPTPKPSPKPIPTPKPQPELTDVPFTVQAPFAEWKDPRQQDACEEASVLMVMHWVQNQPIASKQAAKDEILALADYEDKTYGNYHDTSAVDTAERLIKNYYHYNNYQVKNLSSVDEIIQQLKAGNVVIVPTNGQALGNPYFTAPGPDRHNLVLKSFDESKKQFVTNDPGISQGQNYRYDKEILWNAIRDYPTGNHLPITEVKKDMIVVTKT